MKPFALLLALSLAALPTFSFAADKAAPAITADTAEAFKAQANEIRNGFKEGGRYESIKTEDRQRVEKCLDGIEAILKDGSVAQLDRDQRIKLVNLQEESNAILTRNDGNRLICERTRPTGSHLPVTECKTVAEREHLRKLAQKSMQDETMTARGRSGN